MGILASAAAGSSPAQLIGRFQPDRRYFRCEPKVPADQFFRQPAGNTIPAVVSPAAVGEQKPTTMKMIKRKNWITGALLMSLALPIGATTALAQTSQPSAKVTAKTS